MNMVDAIGTQLYEFIKCIKKNNNKITSWEKQTHKKIIKNIKYEFAWYENKNN